MADSWVITIDIGTSLVKACVYAADGLLVQAAEAPWQTAWRNGGPAEPGKLEFDPADLWGIVQSCLQRVLGEAGDPGASATADRVGAIAVTSQRQGMILLDRAGRDLIGIPNIDSRAREHATRLGARLGEVIYRTAGRWPGTVHPVSKLLWIKDRQPDLFAEVGKVISLAEWVAYRFTGGMATEPTLACETGLFDVKEHQWHEGLCREVGLAPGLFPQPIAAGTPVGLTDCCGTGRLVPVMIAGADTQCGVLGAGSVQAGTCAVIAGTSAPIQRVIDRPVLDSGYRTITNAFVVPGQWVLESNAMMTGLSWAWMAERLGEALRLGSGETEGAWDDDRLYRLMEELAGRAPAGSLGSATYLGVGIMDSKGGSIPQLAGTLLPWAGVAGHSLGLAEIVRSVLEASCFAIKANLEQLNEVLSAARPDVGTGEGPLEMRVAGGSTRSRFWAGTLADILGRKLLVSTNHDATGLGCAVAGFVGLGVHRTHEEATAAMCRYEEVRPNPEAQGLYEAPYARWKRGLDAVKRAAESLRH